MTTNITKNESTLLKAVTAVAISPEDANAVAARYHNQLKAKHSRMTSAERSACVADKIVKRYSKMAAASGAMTSLPGSIPGVGTVVAVTGGAAADMAACMKLQVDMTMCMAAAYGHDMTNEDARHMSYLIAAGGAVEKAGVEGATRIASKAGVKVLRQQLKGATLVAVKAAFKKAGITFTRKAAEKAIPFGIGVVVAGSFNYGLTRYVGSQAKSFFVIDAGMPKVA